MNDKYIGATDVVSKSNCSSLLIELDIGLRSDSLGTQCETIARFPTLFEHNPMPMFVNTGFLKLAEAFHKGPNHIRFFVMMAIRDCEKYLLKIVNIDEFITPIFNVLHSNDPNARTMSLKTIGFAASILYDRCNIRDGLINGLDSRNEKEVDAAICASRAFASRSSKFAANFFKKVCADIASPATSPDTHEKLLHVVCYVKGDDDEVTSLAVRRFLVSQMKANIPSDNLYIAYLATLTKLSLNCITHIRDQVELLLYILEGDFRERIKMSCFKFLKSLIPEGQHLFTERQCRIIFHFLTVFNGERMLMGCLSVLMPLVDSIACKYLAGNKRVVMEATLMAFHSHPSRRVAHYIPLLFSSLLLNFTPIVTDEDTPENLLSFHESVTNAIIFNVFQCAATNCQFSEVEAVCQSIINMVKFKPSFALSLVEALVESLQSANVNVVNIYCQTISAIICMQKLNEGAIKLVDAFIQNFMSKNKNWNSTTQKNLLVLLLQIQVGIPMYEKEKMGYMLQNSVKIDPWELYLTNKAKFHYHLKCLYMISLAEFTLAMSCDSGFSFINTLRYRVTKLEESAYIYEQCLPLYQIASEKSVLNSFQLRYVQIRIHLLRAFVKTLNTCAYYRMQPPSQTSFKIGCMEKQVISKFQECINDFAEITAEYSDLYRSCFDADDTTLNIINVSVWGRGSRAMRRIYISDEGSEGIPEVIGDTSQNGCDLMTTVIKLFTKINPNCEKISVPQNLEHVPLELIYVRKKYYDIISFVNSQNLVKEESLSFERIMSITECVIRFATTSFPLPRFYFQRAQTTVVSLSVSDSAQAASTTLKQDSVVNVSNDVMVSVRVEGSIEYKTKHLNPRHITSIKLTAITEQLSNTYENQFLKNELRTSSMTKLIRPKQGNFSTQLLLSFAGTAGVHKVTVTSSLCDNKESSWWDGPSSTLNVRSTDEVENMRKQKDYAEQKHKDRIKKLN